MLRNSFYLQQHNHRFGCESKLRTYPASGFDLIATSIRGDTFNIQSATLYNAECQERKGFDLLQLQEQQLPHPPRVWNAGMRRSPHPTSRKLGGKCWISKLACFEAKWFGSIWKRSYLARRKKRNLLCKDAGSGSQWVCGPWAHFRKILPYISQRTSIIENTNSTRERSSRSYFEYQSHTSLDKKDI